ncbi:unnamed protein product [Trichobilharzia szidati]|nr:unnamed protein product [Trichobilharzia szidati]
MNIHRAVRNYINKMVSMADGGGMKVLMLDQETLKIVSVVCSMSEIMKYDVYLIERIDSPREPLEHLRCICFIRPTKENISLLSQELRKPNYFSYYIFFSHSITKQLLKQLAEADENEAVVEVQEYFADFIPLSPFLFELDIPISLDESRDMNSRVLNRTTDGITSVLLALKKCPVIRYQNNSEAARQLAESIRSLISRETVLFDFRQTEPAPVLLILDRRQDTVTPLLSQWTYEAMVHELIGIAQNRVSLARAPNVKSDLKEITLDREFDEFYRTNQFSNFGDIGQSIKKLVDNFQKASKSVDAKNLESIGDLKKFLENYPAFRKVSGTVDTHVTLMSELSRIVKEHALLEVSEVEQELVCRDNHASVLSRIKSLVSDPRILLSDALRLVLLYALRYGKQKQELAGLIRALVTRGATDEDIRTIEKLLEYSWPVSTSDGFDLFNVVKSATTSGTSAIVDAQSATKAMASLKKRLVQELKGVDNVYTQHEPLLVDILNKLTKGQLRDASFPSLATGTCWKTVPSGQRPKEIIVFFIGGITYEEVCSVHKINSSTPDVDIIIGGTCVHNSRTFLQEVSAVTKSVGIANTNSSKLMPNSVEPTRRVYGNSRSNIRYGLLQ